MEKVYCSFKNCKVTIWREEILANSVEDITNMMIQGRYCCSNNDAWCDCEDNRCAVKKMTQQLK